MIGRKLCALFSLPVLTAACFSSGCGNIVYGNQEGAKAGKTGKALIEAVYELADGEGQWAILSAGNMAPDQNAWIEAMQAELERNSKYSDLMLVKIAYGNGELEKSKKETEKLIREYPGLEVICVLTAAGGRAATEILDETDSDIKLTGPEIPSEMTGGLH